MKLEYFFPPFWAALSNTHSQYRPHMKHSTFKELGKDPNIDLCDSWIESVSQHKNSIWECSVMAGFMGLEKGIHSLWDPASLIHEITKITLPPHSHGHKCLLLGSQHHICSVVTLDDTGCNSVGHPRLQSQANTALGSSWHKTMVPLWFSVCSSASSFSPATGVKAAS